MVGVDSQEISPNSFSLVVFIFCEKVSCGQSYKALYDRNLRLKSHMTREIAHITTLGLLITIVKCS